MKNFSFIFLGFFLLSLSTGYAQKIVVKSGDLNIINGEKKFNIQYDYSNMSVGKFDEEKDYVSKKVMEYNENEAGSGDKWKKSWIGDRKERYQPKFEELLNKYLKNANVYVGEEIKNEKYIFILHTTFTEPGFNIYITRKPAMIHVDLKIVETRNPDNVVLYIISKNNPGTSMGYSDYDTGIRIQEAYAKCGKELGKFLYKEVWK